MGEEMEVLVDLEVLEEGLDKLPLILPRLPQLPLILVAILMEVLEVSVDSEDLGMVAQLLLPQEAIPEEGSVMVAQQQQQEAILEEDSVMVVAVALLQLPQLLQHQIPIQVHQEEVLGDSVEVVSEALLSLMLHQFPTVK